MVPLEVVLGTVAALGTIGTALFGGGLFKQLITHSNAMAVQKHELETTKKQVAENGMDIKKLTIEQALQGKDIDSFSHHVKKLELLPDISAKLTGIQSLMTYLQEQIRDFRAERVDHDRHNS